MFKNDDVCDLVQIDLPRVRKIREVLVTPDGWGGEISPDEDGE